jgi:hypothetical protein
MNLRAQPVEIYHGGDVVVVPAFAQTEFPELPGEGGQLAELARRGAVAVQTTAAETAPKPAKKRSRRTTPARPRSTGASKKSPGPKTPPPKSPEGGT